MGKIRVKTLGADELESKQKKRDEQRRAVKRAKKEGIAPEDILEEKKEAKEAKEEKKETAPKKEKAGAKLPPNRRPRIRSKRYSDAVVKIERSKLYPFAEAIALIKETSTVKFNGTIEAHFNLTRKPKDLGLKNDKKFPISFERKFPLAHAKLGKVEDAQKDLEKSFDDIVKKIRKINIKKLTLSSSMSPGIKILLN